MSALGRGSERLMENRRFVSAGLFTSSSIHSLFDALWELKQKMLIIFALSTCDFLHLTDGGGLFLSPLWEKAHSGRKFGSPSPS